MGAAGMEATFPVGRGWGGMPWLNRWKGGASVTAIDIKAALKTDPDFKQRVQEACRGHIAQLIQEAHDFFKEAVQFVREKQKDPNRKLVLNCRNGTDWYDVHPLLRETVDSHDGTTA